MIVRQASGFGILGWAAPTSVTLPERGVVLVTGRNGAGKSTLVEAAAVALWGKTLRGTPARRDKEAARCAVHVDAGLELNVVRTWTASGRASVEILGEPKHDTATAAQDRLDALVGPFDAWRRTHVFSGADAAHFSLASDGERKRLIEAVLGLDRFDPALEACRKDLAAVKSAAAAAEATAGRLEERLAAARRALESRPPPAPEVDRAALRRERERLEVLARRSAAAARELQDARRAAERELGAAEAAASAAEREAAALDAGPCRACGQEIAEHLRAAARERARTARQAAASARESARAELARMAEEAEEADEAARTVASKASHAAAEDRAAEGAARERDAALRARQAAHGALEEAVAQLSAAAGKLEEARREADELEAVERALGLRGIRAQVLGRALSGVEAAADAWLTRLGPGLSVRLREGGPRGDQLLLELEGAGGGHGYRAASAGERRRVDVALLLALAEVAASTAGGPPGTLFLDEVFDHLDEDGADRAAEVAEVLGKDRAAVVVTHSREVASRLRPVLRVVAGAAEVRSE